MQASQAENRSLIQLNQLLFDAVDESGLIRAEVNPAGGIPITSGSFFHNSGPVAGESSENSLIKINNFLTNASDGSGINVVIQP